MRWLICTLTIFFVAACFRSDLEQQDADRAHAWQHVELKRSSAGVVVFIAKTVPEDVDYTPVIIAIKEMIQDDEVITISASNDVKLKQFIGLLDALRQAGFDKIRFTASKN